MLEGRISFKNIRIPAWLQSVKPGVANGEILPNNMQDEHDNDHWLDE